MKIPGLLPKLQGQNPARSLPDFGLPCVPFVIQSIMIMTSEMFLLEKFMTSETYITKHSPGDGALPPVASDKVWLHEERTCFQQRVTK